MAAESNPKSPIVEQRRGATKEVLVRKPGQWGVAIDFTPSLEQHNPRVPVFDERELPPEVIVPGSKNYLMVHARFTFLSCDEDARRWNVAAEVYPRFKTIDALRKLDERLPYIKAWLGEVASHSEFPPLPGSEVTLVRYLRKQFLATEMAENTLMILDHSAPLRAARAEQIVRQENALREAREQAKQPRIEYMTPNWKWLNDFPWLRNLLTWRAQLPPPLHPEVQPDEEPIFVPDVDPWMNEYLGFAQNPRVTGVDRALDSLYAILVLDQEGGRKRLIEAGHWGQHFHHTRIANPDAPLSPRLWGKGNNTIVQPDRPLAPPVKLR